MITVRVDPPLPDKIKYRDEGSKSGHFKKRKGFWGMTEAFERIYPSIRLIGADVLRAMIAKDRSLSIIDRFNISEFKNAFYEQAKDFGNMNIKQFKFALFVYAKYQRDLFYKDFKVLTAKDPSIKTFYSIVLKWRFYDDVKDKLKGDSLNELLKKPEELGNLSSIDWIYSFYNRTTKKSAIKDLRASTTGSGFNAETQSYSKNALKNKSSEVHDLLCLYENKLTYIRKLNSSLGKILRNANPILTLTSYIFDSDHAKI